MREDRHEYRADPSRHPPDAADRRRGTAILLGVHVGLVAGGVTWLSTVRLFGPPPSMVEVALA